MEKMPDHPMGKVFLVFYWKIKMSYFLMQKNQNQETITNAYMHFIER